MTINRVVAFLTPVFAGLSAWFVQWVATTLPGHPHLDGVELTVLMGLGATAAVSSALSWLHGWQKHEAHIAYITPELLLGAAQKTPPSPPPAP